MTEELDALAAQHHELAGLIADLDERSWSAPSRCPGWSVADVVLHLAQTDEMALASLDDRLPEHLDTLASAWAAGAASSVDDGAGLLVAAERDGLTPDQVRRRWLEASGSVRRRLAERGDGDRVQWVAGTLSVRTLATTRLAECWIHSGDVADGLGVELAPTDRLRLIARLAWRTLPYAFTRAGHDPPGRVAFELTGPSGEEWRFADDDPAPAPTTVRGTALDLCRVAGQRASAGDTDLEASGPDADVVLALVRTFA
jgi:uncharacterized protein (TIGR03084 family)